MASSAAAVKRSMRRWSSSGKTGRSMWRASSRSEETNRARRQLSQGPGAERFRGPSPVDALIGRDVVVVTAVADDDVAHRAARVAPDVITSLTE
jgi:hypothetical protein